MDMPGLDQNAAYEAMRKVNINSDPDNFTEFYTGTYTSLGYVPIESDIQCSASITLEDGFTDWALAEVAKKLGRTADYDFLMQRSNNWKHLYDEKTGYIRPRHRDGTWLEPFDILAGKNKPSVAEKHKGFSEANASQDTWYCTQNAEGLAKLMGGTEYLRPAPE